MPYGLGLLVFGLMYGLEVSGTEQRGCSTTYIF